MSRLLLLYSSDTTIFLVCSLLRDGRSNGFSTNIPHPFFLKFDSHSLPLKPIVKFLSWPFLLCGCGKPAFSLSTCILISQIELLFLVLNWTFFCVFLLSFLHVTSTRRFRIDSEMSLNKKQIMILNKFLDSTHEKTFRLSDGSKCLIS